MTAPAQPCPICGQQLGVGGCPQHGWHGGLQQPVATDGQQSAYGHEAASPVYGQDTSYGQQTSPAPTAGYGQDSSYGSFGQRAGYGSSSGYGQGSSLPYDQHGFGPVSAVPAVLGPGGPTQLVRPRRTFRDRLPVLTGATVVVLIVAVIVLLVLQISTISSLHTSQRSLASQARTIKGLQSSQAASNRRTSALEAQAKGTLNPSTVAKDVLPSVFRVQAGDEIGTAFALGTAPSDGGTLLVTNYHVVADEEKTGGTSVTLEQGESTKYTGTIVQGDQTHDLAVIKVTQTVPRLKAATKTIQPGEPVVAIGSPLGLTNTLTSGIVSGLRTVPGLESEGEKIQFDAAINPGNSGGPVVNASGQVVGVAQIKIIGNDKTAEGLALAIPISEVCSDLISC